MSAIKVKDGTEIFYKEWGAGQPIFFHHGWPLSGDDWDTQMMFFADKGYRVIAHDRRGHGRSSPSSQGNDMDTYAADVSAVALHLGLRNAVHIGHSTGGGEVIRYVARYGSGGQVAKAVLIGAIPPKLGRSPSNPNGVPPEVIDGIRAGILGNRAQFYRDFSTGPFYGYNRTGAGVSSAVTDNWFKQAMIGDIKAQFDCIGAFADTDFTVDLTNIQQPVFLMHGEDDQVAPLATTSRVASDLLKNGTLKTYPGFPHGMATTHADVINADILSFIRS
ncbi:alpha/beta hydrolase [Methylobacterium sp. J-078]|uniref:alpha/beta fold hydrolase n=1 Tax=Methylobacterium sp. J-078 TaxID=2836657 RepID=UPI001FB9F9AA|nr:alpha/beta hydrolase [Methylobacterium sp. J-078]MCJ2046842.1 alpha/beta hydrolase [Methylobacterium sp. J-078]